MKDESQHTDRDFEKLIDNDDANMPRCVFLQEMVTRHKSLLVNLAARMAPRDGQVRSQHTSGFEAPDLVSDVCEELLRKGIAFDSDKHFVGVFKKRLLQRVSKHLKRINGRRKLNERYTGHGEQ